jgi:phosphoenolpyruvate carboxykinase (ATP)
LAPESNGTSLDLRLHGIINPGPVHARLSRAALIEQALAHGEGLLTDQGALVAYTGSRTGRSPKDRFLVKEPSTQDKIWWGSINRPMEPGVFERLLAKVEAYYQGRELYVVDGAACADPRHRFNVRVVSDKAWHALFSQALFLRPTPEELVDFHPQITILEASGVMADPSIDGTLSEAFIVLSLDRGLVVIGGTEYAGEIKKSVFSFLNYLLPARGVFPMHCSANIGAGRDTALFFGLSGTGKTTLSADPERRLIGDDEHGWSDDGIFNIEGGCYAKTIRLSQQNEPQIWDAIRFGSVLENVVVNPCTRRADYDDERYTENTRAAYPVDFIPNFEPSSLGGHPNNIFFLTCDAFGVLPPLARLTSDQARYHFLSGYTAKVAGTEAGVTEPEATFSTCFAAPFLPLDPTRYSTLLNQKLSAHRAQVWLLNTGWTGGAFGTGSRIKLSFTRAMVDAVLGGTLANAPCTTDPIFGLQVPTSCPGVPPELFRPRDTWKNPADYDARARHLAGLFQANFKNYATRAAESVRQAGPRV